MIDIHSHILPGIDDGAKDEAESLDMLRAAVADGITTIVATPHHQNGRFVNNADIVKEKTARLQQLAKENNIDINIIGSQEVRLYGELLEDFAKGHILPMGRYLLIEFSSSHVSRFAERLFYDMQIQGLTPIIVHPERNSELLKHPEKLIQFVEKGALVQVTATSITGRFGKNIQKFSHRLFEAGAVHFIASDAHNTSSRGFQMQAAFNWIEKKYGAELVEELQENAKAVMENRIFYPAPPEPVKRGKFFGLF